MDGWVDLSQLPKNRRSAELSEHVQGNYGGGPRGFMGGWWGLKEVEWALSECTARLDGDQEILRHYDLDFVSPIYGSDWVRLTAEVVQAEDDHRIIDFRVDRIIDGSYVVWDGIDDPQYGHVDVLPEPILATRGRAIVEVPKARQRKDLPIGRGARPAVPPSPNNSSRQPTSTYDVHQLPPDRVKAEIVEKMHVEEGLDERGFVGPWVVVRDLGWLVTELVVRLDADGGLLVGYDLDFMKPIHALDYLRLKGEIVKIGNTSRQIDILVERYVEHSEDSLGQMSVLDPPELVVKGKATIVVQKSRQRKALPLIATEAP